MTESVISVDLGGTNIRTARLDRHLNILERVQVPTMPEDGCTSVVARIKAQVAEVMPAQPAHVLGIGISAPGPVNPNTGILVAPPNLGDCYNVPLQAELHAAFGVTTYLGNDANVAALAEVAMGAAVGCRNAIFITISTGIGGGIVVDGRLLLGKDGLAAEVGHMVIMTEEDRVSTLEKEAAGPALARQARARLEKGETSLIRELVNGDLSAIKGSTVGNAAVLGDSLALSIVRRAGRIVGCGIASLLHLFNPEIVIVGGGVSLLGELLFAPMREAWEKYTIDPAYWRDLRFAPAALGDNVSVIGAGALVVTQGGVTDVTSAVRRLDAS